MSARSERQRVLRSILEEQAFRTQAAIGEALSAAGHPTHPATVGRDLEEIGARRIRTADGHLAYRTDDAPVTFAAPSDLLDEALRRYVLRVEASGNLLVLRTPPACASPVASALDISGGPAILGTLAGDDTVIAVVADGHDPQEVADALRRRSADAVQATTRSSRTSNDRSPS